MNEYFEDIRDYTLFNWINSYRFDDLDTERVKQVNTKLLEVDELIDFKDVISNIEIYLWINSDNKKLVEKGISKNDIKNLVELILEESDDYRDKIKEKALLFKDIQSAQCMYKEIQNDALKSKFYDILHYLENIKNWYIVNWYTIDWKLFNWARFIFDELDEKLQLIYSDLEKSNNLWLLEKLWINNDLLQKINKAFLKNSLIDSIINKDWALEHKYENFPNFDSEESKVVYL